MIFVKINIVVGNPNIIVSFFSAFSGLSLLIFLSQAIGNKLLRMAAFSTRSRLENFLLGQGLGFAAISYSIFALGLLGGINRVLFIIVYIVLLPLVFFNDVKKSFLRIASALKKKVHNLKLGDTSALTLICILLLLIFVFINLINCFLPPLGRDALKYHLRMPKHYIEIGRVQPISTNIFSRFPQLIEMLHTFLLLLFNDYAPQLLHTYFGILTTFAIFMFIRRRASLGSAIICCLTFYSLPVVSQISSWAYVDLSLSFYTVLSFGLYLEGLQKLKTNLFTVSACLLGIALGIKYLALISVVIAFGILCIYLFIIERGQRSVLLRQGMKFFAITAIIGSPYYARNIILEHNPVFPFFYSIFKGENWDASRALLYQTFLRSYGMGHSLKDLLLLPWRIAVFGREGLLFDGAIGMIYITLTPFLLWLRPRHKFPAFTLIYSFPFFLIWAILSQQIRFLLPAFAIFSTGLYVIFEKIPKGKLIHRASINLLVLLLAAFNLTYPLKQINRYKPFLILGGKTSRKEF
ncbi:MAG: hypothetical protein ABH858_00010, partial [Candidatus Omnitrophota bacterium]